MDSNNKIAALQSLVDHLKTEISTLNNLLITCGFSEGIQTLRQSAEELVKILQNT